MSSLHKLKAYFGMVPVDDGYYTDDGYAYDEPRHDERPEPAPARREPALAAARSEASYDADATRPVPRLEPLAPRAATRRPTAPPTRGALAVDPGTERRAEPRRVEPRVSEPGRRGNPFAEDGHPLGTITTLHPRTYNEARTIGERFREGNPVIMNLTEMSDPDAKRLVDFAAGLAFAMRGAIDKVTNKVFLLSPSDVDVSAEDKRRIVENGFYQHG